MDFKLDRKSTRLNSSHLVISYAVFCLKKKKAFPGAVLGPLRHLAQPDLVLHWIAIDSDREFGHGAGDKRADVILPELHYCDGDRLIQALGINIDAMENAVRIGEGHTAAGTGHGKIIAESSLFIRPWKQRGLKDVGSRVVNFPAARKGLNY